MARWRVTRAPSAPSATERVVGYRDLTRVGSGGFSVVYKARQAEIGRTVALKVLAVEFVDAGILRQFLREVQLTARLTGHPNVVTVLDSGLAESGRPYIAMEYYDRGSLRDRLKAEGPLPVREALRAAVKIAAALEAAHAEGVLHRDVKPQNILISRYGEPALADFGTARLSAAIDVSSRSDALTPMHAAPEVLEGHPATELSDIYSLGSTLYHLLAGKPAFKTGEEGVAAFLLRALTQPLPPIERPDVPAAVRTEIARAMDRDPARRHQSAALFAQALQAAQAAAGLPVTETPDHTPTAQRLSPEQSVLEQPALEPLPPEPVPQHSIHISQLSASTNGAGPSTAAPSVSPWAPETTGLAAALEAVPPTIAPPNAEAAPSVPAALSQEPAVPVAPAAPVEPAAPDIGAPGAPGAPATPDDAELPIAALPWSGTDTMTGHRFAFLTGTSASSTAPTAPTTPTKPLSTTSSTAPTVPGRATSAEVTPVALPDSRLPSTSVPTSMPLGGELSGPLRIDLDQRPVRRRIRGTIMACAGAVVSVGILAVVFVSAAHSSGAPMPPNPSQSPSSDGVRMSSPPSAAPQAAAGLAAQATGTTVTLTWRMPATNPFPLLLDTDTGSTGFVPLPAATTSYSVGGLNAGRQYCFRIGTVVALGASPDILWSQSVCSDG